MLQSRRWINPYVSLSDTMPERLLSCREREPQSDEVARVQSFLPSSAPLVVELGSGSGGHILERARLSPESFHIGFELRYKRAFRTAEKAEQKGLKNLYVIRTDIAYLNKFFTPGSISTIFINFPDPWERKKWKKHRMISETTIPMFHTLLNAGGVIRYKTDHEGYFDDSLELMASSTQFDIAKTSRDLHSTDIVGDNVLTEFEQLFISKNMPIFYAEFVQRT